MSASLIAVARATSTNTGRRPPRRASPSYPPSCGPTSSTREVPRNHGRVRAVAVVRSAYRSRTWSRAKSLEGEGRPRASSNLGARSPGPRHRRSTQSRKRSLVVASQAPIVGDLLPDDRRLRPAVTPGRHGPAADREIPLAREEPPGASQHRAVERAPFRRHHLLDFRLFARPTSWGAPPPPELPSDQRLGVGDRNPKTRGAQDARLRPVEHGAGALATGADEVDVAGGPLHAVAGPREPADQGDPEAAPAGDAHDDGDRAGARGSRPPGRAHGVTTRAAPRRAPPGAPSSAARPARPPAAGSPRAPARRSPSRPVPARS